MSEKVEYHFCPTCREQGRTRRISADQAITNGICNECLEDQAKQEETEVATEATPIKRGPGRPPKAATTAATAGQPVKKVKVPTICECGCGGTTKGGRFIPGHDARLHGLEKRGLSKAEAQKIGALPDAERKAVIAKLDEKLAAKKAKKAA